MATTAKMGETTFTTPSDREVAATRVFDAPRKLVWEAHTKPEHLSKWMLVEGFTMPVCEIDLRQGGKWRIVWRKDDGSEMELHGVYKEIVAPEKLVYTENWGGDWPESIQSVSLTEKDGRTTLVSTLLYPSKKDRDAALGTGMKEGWSEGYDSLDEYLAKMA